MLLTTPNDKLLCMEALRISPRPVPQDRNPDHVSQIEDLPHYLLIQKGLATIRESLFSCRFGPVSPTRHRLDPASEGTQQKSAVNNVPEQVWK